MRLPFSVQVFLAASLGSAWSVLLLQRNARPELALPDFWQGVSGALEPGETFEQAALREVGEETSIHLGSVIATGFEQTFPIKTEWRTSYGDGPTQVLEKVFYAIVPAMSAPALSHEHKAFRWCGEQEGISLLTFANNALCVQSVFQALARAPADETTALRGAPHASTGK